MNSSRAILVVEDRDSLRRLLKETLSSEGYRVFTAESVARARTQIEKEQLELVLTDLRLPDGSGLDVLRLVRERSTAVPVVVITAFGSVSSAVEAMKLGAVDFLEKPIELDDLTQLVASWIGDDRAEISLDVPGGLPIVGRHPKLRAALRLLKKVAPSESTVLLTGESGTGKELFARALHAFSGRQAGPFVALNCAAIPETLIENELFGHEKGAFTGASARQLGRFEQAQGGTLLLDEIGDLPRSVQAKVLRVLEDRTFERVGGGRTMVADVRLAAATNRDLGAMVEAGEFRADLFYRLEVFPIELPPLRERSSDIPELATHLLLRVAERNGVDPPQLSAAARSLLEGQAWPGNVRQLANVLERAVILADGPILDAPDLAGLLKPLGASGDAQEKVRQALLEANGDKRRAAGLLGVSYRTLQRRVKDLDLEGYPLYRR